MPASRIPGEAFAGTACTCGAIAQLGERLNGIQEVVGSIPIGSTKPRLVSVYIRVLSVGV